MDASMLTDLTALSGFPLPLGLAIMMCFPPNDDWWPDPRRRNGMLHFLLDLLRRKN